MLDNIGYALAYSGVGLALLVLGFVVLDLLTPGRLASHIWHERSVNAGIVLSSGFIGLGLVIFTAIWTNSTSGFGEALGWTVVFGLLGVAMQAIAFLLLDLFTPGKLGETVCLRDFHPASLVTAASQLAIAGIVVASIA
jgi:uncharacterized membrane protein YjfL (UPF0719 family)